MIAITHGKLDSILTLHHKTWKSHDFGYNMEEATEEFRGDSGDADVYEVDEY